MEHLGLSAEGETPDAAVTLKLNTCLGCCTQGPAMSFDGRLRGPMDANAALQELDRLRAEAAP